MAIGIGAAILGAAGLSVASSLFGASKQASAANRAGRLQSYAARQARRDLRPYAETGENALARLADLYGLNGQEAQQAAFEGFTVSPGYEFRLGQGVEAIDRSAAARGNLFSGNTGRALTEFGQGMASSEYDNYLARLGELTRGGQSAAAGQGAAGVQGAIGQGNALMNAGAAYAQGAQGVSNAITGAASNYIYDQRYNDFLSAMRA